MINHDNTNTDEHMRREFNEWAQAGRGEEMENHHISITQQTLALMKLKPGQRVLDLGCGAGWASRLLAQMVGGGEHRSGVPRPPGFGGMGWRTGGRTRRLRRDDSPRPRHLHRIRQHPVRRRFGAADSVAGRLLRQGALGGIVLLLRRPGRCAGRSSRVMAPGGELNILINLYKDNHYSLRWVEELNVPVQVKSEQEYLDLFRSAWLRERARRAHSRPVADAGRVQRKVVQERRRVERLQAHRGAAAGGPQACHAPAIRKRLHHRGTESTERQGRI